VNPIEIVGALEQVPGGRKRDEAGPADPYSRRRRTRRLAEFLAPSLSGILRQPLDEALTSRIIGTIDAFFAVYEARPLRDNSGGASVNDSLCLFVIARLTDPALIVESGTGQGHSAWLLRQACPAAEIHSFDIDHGALAHRCPDVSYHLGDWSGWDLPPHDPARTLVWFDDHVDQARRLQEAAHRGLRGLLFDDVFSADTLYATGRPPVPTIAMLLDEALTDGQELSWHRNGKLYRVRIDLAYNKRARALLEEVWSLPDLTALTRYSPGSGMTFVRITP